MAVEVTPALHLVTVGGPAPLPVAALHLVTLQLTSVLLAPFPSTLLTIVATTMLVAPRGRRGRERGYDDHQS
jgi:hypothetical protein